MTTVQRLLDAKGRDIYSVHPDDMVIDALRIMENKDIGSVLVKEGERLVGIFTERHYSRNVFLKGKSSPTTPIREVMKTKVLCVAPEQEVESCMVLMTQARVRHIPVLRGEQIIGVISIGDIVKGIIEDKQYTIEQMEQYIRG